MLQVGSKHGRKVAGGVLIARDTANNQNIWWVPDKKDALPTQKICGNPLQVVENEEMLRIFKKFSLGKKDIAKLMNFYKDPDELDIDFGDEWKLKCAFQCLEKLIIRSLKTCYVNECASLQTLYDQSTNHSHALIGPTRSGKTYGMAQILLRPEFENRKVYVFSLNPSDSSIQMLKQRKRKRKTVFVDMDRVHERKMKLRDSVSPDSILVFDDTLELERTDPMRGTLLALMNETLSRGRHHKSSRNSPGCAAYFCGHIFKAGRDLQYLWNEVPYLSVYPSSSKHKIRDFLIKSLNLHRNDVDRILGLAEGSRSICFHIQKPMFAQWDTGLCLL